MTGLASGMIRGITDFFWKAADLSKPGLDWQFCVGGIAGKAKVIVHPRNGCKLQTWFLALNDFFENQFFVACASLQNKTDVEA